MLTKRIIPCLDVKNGQVVKGVKFRDHKIVGDIVNLANYYSESGADELVFYDITASVERRDLTYNWIEKISCNINIPFTVGGGIRTIEDIRKVLSLGADKISINSPAIKNPNLINEASLKFGSQCIVIGVDSKNISGEDYIHQFTGDINTTKNTKLKTDVWIKEVIDRGAGEVVLNSMDEDGVRNGYNIKLLKKIEKICSVPLIASGGAGFKKDFLDVFLKTKVDGALAASVFHKKEIRIKDLKQYLKEKNIIVRI